VLLEFNLRRKNIKLYGRRIFIRVYALRKYRGFQSLPRKFKAYVILSNNSRWFGSVFRSYSSLYVYVPREEVPKILMIVDSRKRIRLKMYIRPVLSG
jgi:hypothetical protein